LDRDAFLDNETQKFIDEQKQPITGIIEGVTDKIRFSVEVKDGIPHGITEVYQRSERSLIYEAEYLNGQRHGISRSYHGNGLPALEMTYEYGSIGGLVTAWLEDGSLVHEVILRRGKAVAGYRIQDKKAIYLADEELSTLAKHYEKGIILSDMPDFFLNR
jgi:antitoxin component YwqK of YwqJK toxin-antitoxin module